MYDFHMDFQFPGQKSLPRDLQMDMASPWQLKWASFLAMGLLVQILFSRHSLCIYPYVKTCPFFLRPTFFSKNQPTLYSYTSILSGELGALDAVVAWSIVFFAWSMVCFLGMVELVVCLSEKKN